MRTNNLQRFISVIMITCCIIAASACNKSNKADNEEKEELQEDIVELRDDQLKLANIETGMIELRSLSGIIKVNGTVTTSPQNLATVCMPLGGFVKSTTLIPGQAVKKGQTLAILENQEFVDIQQAYVEAKNKLEYAAAEYKRHSELYKDEVYSQKNLQQVTTEYKNLKAQVKALEEKLSLIGIDPALLHEDDISSHLPVVSPIDGYVKTVNINLGKFVTPSDVLFEIVNRDNLLLELTLYEKDADKVTAGQKVSFFINNETEPHEAVIFQTSGSVSNDRTYRVYARVSASCRNILPGMYVSASIETRDEMIPSLPTGAIVTFDDKDYIFVFVRQKMEANRPFTEFRMVEVKKGLTGNGFSEVILPDGIDIKDLKVVIKGAYNLLSAKKNAGEMAC